MRGYKPVYIAGGGLAGLALGIALRQAGVPVAVLEAGAYPRHRVCGEFLSGKGHEVLERLGLTDRLRNAGALVATTSAFMLTKRQFPPRPLPYPALNVSRHVLDLELARTFQQLGGQLHERTRCASDLDREGWVIATGRRPLPVDRGWRWYGLKAHARNVPLEADLEMHFRPDGYVGLNRLAGGEVNICGLFRKRVGAAGADPGWQATLRGEPGTYLYQRLSSADFDEKSFCSVAGLGLEPRRARDLPGCRIGDALTMTPPVTGNGMSMALEAAALAAGTLTSYSTGEISWEEARRAVARTCDAAFDRRLAWARWLQKGLFIGGLPYMLGTAILSSRRLWTRAFALTR